MYHKLNIFKEVSLTKSFTKAAMSLHISQPAISKQIKQLEETYGKSFFKRLGSKIELTQEGQIFLGYVNRILSIYKEAEDHFQSLNNHLPDYIQFGASSTIAQYTIPIILSKIYKKFPTNSFSMINGNTQQIEDLILDEQLDFGVVEGNTSNNLLQYSSYIEDELVLVTSSKNTNYLNSNTIEVKDLARLPFALRESGSGTKDIIEYAIKNHNIELQNTRIRLGSTESIKQYISNTSSCFSFLSIHSIQNELKHNTLKTIEIKDFKINRSFHFVSRQGYRSNTFDFFQKLLRSNYNE